MKNYYYILGISSNASLNEIKSAFRKLSKKFHPDVNSNDKFFEERFKDIIEAYEILSSDTKKKQYDNLLRKKEESSIHNIEKLRRDFEDQVKKFEEERVKIRMQAQKEREDFEKYKKEFFTNTTSSTKTKKPKTQIHYKRNFLILFSLTTFLLLSAYLFNMTKKTAEELLYWSKCDQFHYHKSAKCNLIKNCSIQSIDYKTADLWELTYHNCTK